MKLYLDPISTTSRPIMMFAAEHHLPIDMITVSLLQGEHLSPAFMSLNPNGCVPVLVDGGFVLTESSAILKYLAELANSPAYPRAPRDRARINAAMDWVVTNFHIALGHELAYPTLFPAMHPFGPQALEEITASGAAGAKRWLQVLDAHLIGPDRNYIAGEELTIADYLGSSVAILAEAVSFDLTPYRNVRRWLATMKARPSWDGTYAAFYGLMTALRPAA